ncbi:extracellular solute-binding protein [Cohnella silvisoli]|uniref:Extracellular solute-binding protein n=1 Tax=Cohnella silvisoli TaxID=2873699 RepID=A0ABV1KLU5_9BACL|nr:extracellular solute-binding protein [Cohnella silvisoli]MCD9020611.1 extracellular solute-binding protein [Cohnella silvisoli]
MKWKTLLLFCAVLMLAASVSACGSNKNENSTPSSPAAETKSTESASTEPSNSGEAPVAELEGDFEIQYFVGGYGDAWWKSVIAQFKEKYPKLNIKESAGPKINDQMKPRWIQGDPPDVIYLDGAGSNARQQIEDGQLLDLTDWIKEAANIDGEKITDKLIGQPDLFDGKVYTLPLVFGSWGVFYDKALFTQNNWEVPTDFESFLTVSEKIKAAGISPLVHAGVYPGYLVGGVLNPAIVSANGDDASILVDIANAKEGVYKSEAVLKALGQLVTLRDKGYLDKSAIALNHTDSQIQFLQHKDAFIPNGLWLENEMKKDTPAGFSFGWLPSITQAPGGKYVAVPYTNAIAIAKKAKNPEAAKAFLQFIYTSKAAVEWAEKTGALMNLKIDLESANASEVSKAAAKFYSSDNIVVAPTFAYAGEMGKTIEDATIALIDGKITPEQWAERAEKQAATERSKAK